MPSWHLLSCTNVEKKYKNRPNTYLSKLDMRGTMKAMVADAERYAG